MSRLKVVHLTSVHHPFDVRVFRKQCSTLAQQGHDVVLIAPHDEGGVFDGVRLRALAKPRGRWERMTLVPLRLLRAALEEKGDIYHVHDPELLPCAQLLHRLGKRVVFDMHENTPKSLLTKTWLAPELRSPVSRAFAVVESAMMKGLPVVFAEDSYLKDYPSTKAYVSVLNMPLVEELAQVSVEKFGTPSVGYIGGVTEERGSIVTIQALDILQRQGTPVHFECLGPAVPEHRARLESMISNMGLDVHLPGRVPSDAGWKQMARCHVGLAVLKPIPNYIESYPTKMFEYMALGLPVVVTDVPLYRSIVDRFGCGLCVDSEDPEAVANGIAFLLQHTEEARLMGARGRSAVLKHFNWSNEFQKLDSFYRQLTARDRLL